MKDFVTNGVYEPNYARFKLNRSVVNNSSKQHYLKLPSITLNNSTVESNKSPYEYVKPRINTNMERQTTEKEKVITPGKDEEYYQ